MTIEPLPRGAHHRGAASPAPPPPPPPAADGPSAALAHMARVAGSFQPDPAEPAPSLHSRQTSATATATTTTATAGPDVDAHTARVAASFLPDPASPPPSLPSASSAPGRSDYGLSVTHALPHIERVSITLTPQPPHIVRVAASFAPDPNPFGTAAPAVAAAAAAPAPAPTPRGGPAAAVAAAAAAASAVAAAPAPVPQRLEPLATAPRPAAAAPGFDSALLYDPVPSVGSATAVLSPRPVLGVAKVPASPAAAAAAAGPLGSPTRKVVLTPLGRTGGGGKTPLPSVRGSSTPHAALPNGLARLAASPLAAAATPGRANATTAGAVLSPRSRARQQQQQQLTFASTGAAAAPPQQAVSPRAVATAVASPKQPQAQPQPQPQAPVQAPPALVSPRVQAAVASAASASASTSTSVAPTPSPRAVAPPAAAAVASPRPLLPPVAAAAVVAVAVAALQPEEVQPRPPAPQQEPERSAQPEPEPEPAPKPESQPAMAAPAPAAPAPEPETESAAPVPVAPASPPLDASRDDTADHQPQPDAAALGAWAAPASTAGPLAPAIVTTASPAATPRAVRSPAARSPVAAAAAARSPAARSPAAAAATVAPKSPANRSPAKSLARSPARTPSRPVAGRSAAASPVASPRHGAGAGAQARSPSAKQRPGSALPTPRTAAGATAKSPMSRGPAPAGPEPEHDEADTASDTARSEHEPQPEAPSQAQADSADAEADTDAAADAEVRAANANANALLHANTLAVPANPASTMPQESPSDDTRSRLSQAIHEAHASMAASVAAVRTPRAQQQQQQEQHQAAAEEPSPASSRPITPPAASPSPAAVAAAVAGEAATASAAAAVASVLAAVSPNERLKACYEWVCCLTRRPSEAHASYGDRSLLRSLDFTFPGVVMPPCDVRYQQPSAISFVGAPHAPSSPAPELKRPQTALGVSPRRASGRASPAAAAGAGGGGTSSFKGGPRSPRATATGAPDLARPATATGTRRAASNMTATTVRIKHVSHSSHGAGGASGSGGGVLHGGTTYATLKAPGRDEHVFDIMSAIRRGDLARLKTLTAPMTHAQLDREYSFGFGERIECMSPLVCAVRAGHLTVVTYLIAVKGCSVNQYLPHAVVRPSAAPMMTADDGLSGMDERPASAGAGAGPLVPFPTTALLCAVTHERRGAAALRARHSTLRAAAVDDCTAESLLEAVATATTGLPPGATRPVAAGDDDDDDGVFVVFGLASSVLAEWRSAFPISTALLETGANPQVVIQHLPGADDDDGEADHRRHGRARRVTPNVTSAIGLASRPGGGPASLRPELVGLLALSGASWQHHDRLLGFTHASVQSYRLGRSLPLLLEVEKELWRNGCGLSLATIALVLQWCVLSEQELGFEHHRDAGHNCALFPPPFSP